MTDAQPANLTDAEREDLIAAKLAAAREARAVSMAAIDRGLGAKRRLHPDHADPRRGDLVKAWDGRITAHGVELTDLQHVVVERAEHDFANPRKGHKVEDRVKALARIRKIDGRLADAAEALAMAGQIEAMNALHPDAEVVARAGGYIRMPKHDGMVTLFAKGRMDEDQLRAGWMYRQLFEVDPMSMKVASMDVGGGHRPDSAFIGRLVEGVDREAVGRITAAVKASSPDDDGLRLAVLDHVARAGHPLRGLTGGGRAWSDGLAHLVEALNVVRAELISMGLDSAER